MSTPIVERRQQWIRESGFRISYKGTEDRWHGALRRGKNVVWVCDHLHRNREYSSTFSHGAAKECAKDHLNELATEAVPV